MLWQHWPQLDQPLWTAEIRAYPIRKRNPARHWRARAIIALCVPVTQGD